MTITQIVFVALGGALGYMLGKHQEATAAKERSSSRPLFTGIGGGVIAFAIAVAVLEDSQPPEWTAEIIEVRTSTDLNRVIEEHRGAVLVDFYADWCMPCRRMAPHVNELARSGEAVVAVVDVDENPVLAEKHQAFTLPMVAVFRDGQLVRREYGYHSLAELHDMVTETSRKTDAAAASDRAGVTTMRIDRPFR